MFGLMDPPLRQPLHDPPAAASGHSMVWWLAALLLVTLLAGLTWRLLRRLR